jgi:hypothetical protein
MSPEDLAIEAWDLSLSDSDEAEGSLAMPSTQLFFFRRSHELRDIVYEYCAHEDKGLFYEYENDIMRVADGRKPDASFALSCSRVAREMKGVALWANTISFTTVFNQASSQRAEMFHYAIPRHCQGKARDSQLDGPSPTFIGGRQSGNVAVPSVSAHTRLLDKGIRDPRDKTSQVLLWRNSLHQARLCSLHPEFHSLAPGPLQSRFQQGLQKEIQEERRSISYLDFRIGLFSPEKLVHPRALGGCKYCPKISNYGSSG